MVHQTLKYIRTVSVCLILSISANHASAQNAKCEKEAKEIKNFQLSSSLHELADVPFYNMSGETRSLEEYKGKVTLLNHWAIWCAPCLREMPSILRLSKVLDDQKFIILPISMDRSGVEKVHRFVIKNKWNDLAYFNDPKMLVARHFDVQTIPATQIFDSHGVEFGRLVGIYEWDRPEVVTLLTCLAQ
jgi:thiol-disulfide isomerase/thioredoxin